MTRVLRLLQLDELTWSTIGYQELPGRVLTVLFTYGILTWNRFGLLSFVAPRAPVRLMLVGIYAWLAIAVVLWVTGIKARAEARPDGGIRFRDAAVAAAVIHVPLLALGFFMAIVAGFARILGPSLILAVVVFTLWMPALLTRAFREVAGLQWRGAVLVAVGVQLAWLAGPGRFLNNQVGHLL